MNRDLIFLKTMVLFLIGEVSFSQGVTREILLNLTPAADQSWIQEIDLTSMVASDFIALSLAINGQDINANTIKVNLKTNKKWHEVPPFGEDAIQENRFVSELLYLKPDEAGKILISITKNANLNLSNASGKIRIFVPQSIEYTTEPQTISAGPRFFVCPCPQPNYVPRSSWGSGFRLTGDIYIPPAVYTKVTHMIVHHSAGTNTSNNWTGVVAAIFDFHVNTNGWQDVGYNWLIDPNGVIYEGRGGGDNVRGAHMCGYNSNSAGICLLGNFVTAEPTNEMLSALTSLLSWKACKDNITPNGSSNIVSYPGIMQHISGHRDGCAPNYTECPGPNLYSKLNGIRSSTSQYINDVCGQLSDSKDVFVQNKLEIIPNPAMDRLKVMLGYVSSVFDIKIMDVSGRIVVATKEHSTSADLNISQLQNGLYFLKVETAGKTFIGRFVKY